MKTELINQTNYANIYCLYSDQGKPIGTKEVVIAGRNVGAYYYSLTSKTRAEVKKLFKQAETNIKGDY
jgi:tRNA A37 methylthiotransferase MiaB